MYANASKVPFLTLMLVCMWYEESTPGIQQEIQSTSKTVSSIKGSITSIIESAHVHFHDNRNPCIGLDLFKT